MRNTSELRMELAAVDLSAVIAMLSRRQPLSDTESSDSAAYLYYVFDFRIGTSDTKCNLYSPTTPLLSESGGTRRC